MHQVQDEMPLYADCDEEETSSTCWVSTPLSLVYD